MLYSLDDIASTGISAFQEMGKNWTTIQSEDDTELETEDETDSDKEYVIV